MSEHEAIALGLLFAALAVLGGCAMRGVAAWT